MFLAFLAFNPGDLHYLGYLKIIIIVAEWLACWTQAQKGPGSNGSRGTVGYSLRQTVNTPIWPCVCLCLSQVGVLLKWQNMGSRKQHRTIA